MRMGGNRRTSQLSSKRAAAALAQLLSGCTSERLASFTAAGLAATHNVPLSRAEAMLAAARQGRAHEDNRLIHRCAPSVPLGGSRDQRA
jgi:hypothetical protein